MEKLFLNLGNNYRLYVISDVHGNYPLLRELIESLDIKETDYFIFLGDLINRFPYSLECLNYVIDLQHKCKCFYVIGNHEYALYDLIKNFESLSQEQLYIYSRGTELIKIFEYWSNEFKLNEDNSLEVLTALKNVRKLAKREIHFIESMNSYIETEDFIFVHAGVERNKKLEDNTIIELTENYGFFEKGHNQDKTVIVGHWPTKAIPDDKVCSDIKFLDKTIFIDGGNSMDMKLDKFIDIYGQLNCLIIEKDEEIKYSTKFVEVTDFYEVIEEVIPKNKGIILNYKNYKVTVTDYNKDFYICNAENSGEQGLLLKEFYQIFPFPTTYAGKFLSAKKGDIVNLKYSFKNYSLVKLNSEFGLISNKFLKKII